MQIYDRIRILCKSKGVTVTGTEKDLGFARGSLCKIDRNKPSAEKLQRLADYLGVSTNYLMTGEETDYYFNDETAEIAQEIFRSEDLKMLFHNVRKMPPEDLAVLKGMAEALIRKERPND